MKKPVRVLAALLLSVPLVLLTPRESLAGDEDVALDLGSSSIDLRLVPRGTFRQGSPESEVGRSADEAEHAVTISRSFWIGRELVTRGQYALFVTETTYVTDAEKNDAGGLGWDGKRLIEKKGFTWKSPGFAQTDDDPVVLVSLTDAKAFAAWASVKSGKTVRLPTEAEWEYAARAGTSTPWFGASEESEALELGWFQSNAGDGTRPVGLKRANAFGLFDMTGNVLEWCRDVYGPYPSGSVTDPENRASSDGGVERRVLRGGSWLREPARARSAARHKSEPTHRDAETGFRILVEDVADAGAGKEHAEPNPVELLAAQGPALTTIEPDASAPSAQPTAPKTPTEGLSWSLVASPFAGAALAVAWVLGRRRYKSKADD